MDKDIQKEYSESNSIYSMQPESSEKISMSASDLLRCIYSFFDKKHINRIFYFIDSLDEKTKESIPTWMKENFQDLVKYEKKYFEQHFNPLQFRKRLNAIDKNFVWKNVINLNGGHAALDILLHTVLRDDEEMKIIERIYPNKKHTTGIEELHKTIEEQNFQIKLAKSFGILQQEEFYFCFDEFIANGRHPDPEEFRSGWHEKAIVHLWDAAPLDAQSTSNEISLEKEKIKVNYSQLLSERHLNTLDIENRIERIFSVSRRSRTFIHHSDFHRFNILILPNDDFRIIDWAGWSFAKVGMGYPVKRRGKPHDYFTHEIISEIIDSFFRQTNGITLEEFSANFVLYNAHYSLDSDPELGFIFLDYFFAEFTEK